MKKPFKFLVLVLCLAMCAAFTACDKEPTSSASETSQDVSSAVVSSTESDLPTVSDMITDDTSSADSTDDASSETESENDGAQVYSEVLTGYKKVVDSIVAGTFDMEAALADFPCLNESISYKWSSMLGELQMSTEKLGYALYDIDKDGNDELFLINSDYVISAIFTVNDDKVQLLDAYWARYTAKLCDDNTVFTSGSSGASNFETVVYKLSEGSFVDVASFGCDDGNFFMISDGEHVEITRQEYADKADSYKSINDSLNFVAI